MNIFLKSIKSKASFNIRNVRGIDDKGNARLLNPTGFKYCGKYLGNCEDCIHRISFRDDEFAFYEVMERTASYCDGYFGDVTITAPESIFHSEAYFKDATMMTALEIIPGTPKKLKKSPKKKPKKRTIKKPKKSKAPKRSKKPKKK